MIESSRIRLRKWSEADLHALQVWRNDVALQGQLLARVRGNSLEQVRQWVQARSDGPDSILLIVASLETDRAMGYVQLVGLDEIDQCGDLGICIAPASQGAGIGREAISLLIENAHRLRQLRKIELRVRVDNEKAIRCYESVGFMRCGVLHARTFVGGAYWDVLLMERFVPRPEGGVA